MKTIKFLRTNHNRGKKNQPKKSPNSPLSIEELLDPVRKEIEYKENKYIMNYESFKDLMVNLQGSATNYQS